jgi:hypothetical protein
VTDCAQFERATSAEWTRVEERITSLEASLPEKVNKRGTGFWHGKSKRADTWFDYCQLRAHMIVLESIARFIRRVNTHLSSYREQLNKAQFSLSRVANHFSSEQRWLDTVTQSRSELPEKKSLAHTIGRLIESRMPDLVSKMDQGLGDELIRLESSKPPEEEEQLNAQRFARALRAKSWAVLAEALGELDLANRLFAGSDQAAARLGDYLQDALPRLPKSGGGKRLLVVAPETTQDETIRSGLKECENGQFSVMRTGESELVLCYEVQDLSLPIVATRLVEHHENCIPAASRLHTRIDVTWPQRMVW